MLKARASMRQNVPRIFPQSGLIAGMISGSKRGVFILDAQLQPTIGLLSSDVLGAPSQRGPG